MTDVRMQSNRSSLPGSPSPLSEPSAPPPTTREDTVDPTDIRDNPVQAGSGVPQADQAAPLLPDATGPLATESEVRETADWFAHENPDTITTASMMWHVLLTVGRAAAQETKTARDLQHTYQDLKLGAKKTEIAETEQRFEAEKKQALFMMCFSLAGTAVGMGAGYKGANMTGNASGVWNSLAFSVPQMFTQMGTAIDKSAGYGKQVYAQQILEKEAQMLQEVFDHTIESQKIRTDEARQHHKDFLKLIADHVDRRAQAHQKMTSY